MKVKDLVKRLLRLDQDAKITVNIEYTYNNNGTTDYIYNNEEIINVEPIEDEYQINVTLNEYKIRLFFTE